MLNYDFKIFSILLLFSLYIFSFDVCSFKILKEFLVFLIAFKN